MGYLHIDNLYKNQEILMFKECYAMEKIHGTSAHIRFKNDEQSRKVSSGGIIHFFSGGEKHIKFLNIFNRNSLYKKLSNLKLDNIYIYGEAYGGKQQGMREVYGNDLKFIAFDVKINNCWLSVLDAEKFVLDLELEFVHYKKMTTDIKDLEIERNCPSVQSVINGIKEPKEKEGLVLRPLIEFIKNNGSRVICKYKNDSFMETSKPRKIIDPEQLKILEDAKQVADEWVTEMRLSHVLDKININDITEVRKLIFAMVEDIKREGDKEIKWSKQVEKNISKKTATMFKNRLQNKLKGKELLDEMEWNKG